MKILLTQGKAAIIDVVDYDLIRSIKWCAVKNGNNWYAKHKTIYLHRFLLNPKSNEECDHINGDGLDNRRCNLRIVTSAQNSMNSQKRPGYTSSRFKGVSWDKANNRWRADICVDYKKMYLGLFSDEVEAVKAYNVTASEYFGEYAKLNQFTER